MSKSTTTKASQAKPTKAKPQEPLNLASATVATGALAAPKSIYEIMGLTSKLYSTADYATYQKDIASMSLHTLHEHAYEVGIAANGDRNLLIDALERRFIKEHGRQGGARETVKKTQAEEMREQALRALAHGA